MTALRNTLVGGLTVLALLVVLPSPARASWVECESTAPGELHVGVLLVPGQDELDPAIGSIAWRTVGPTEKVFYEGPKLNFGMTVTGLLPGTYSVVYEYHGSDGDSSGRFCSLIVAAGPTPAPARTPAPTRTPAATAAPTPRPSVPTSLATAAPVMQAPLDGVASTPPLSGETPGAPPTATPAASEPTTAPAATGGVAALTIVGLALVALGLLLALAALLPRRR